jgi:hypothetical protein
MVKEIPRMASKWIEQVFQAASVKNGNVVRRKKLTVIRYASLQELETEVKLRGFHMIETGDQVVIICNNGHFHLVC